MFNITQQTLMDQQSQIRKKQSLRKLELEKIQKRLKNEPHGHLPNDSEKDDEQWFLGFHEKCGDAFLNDVRVVVEDIGNPHENAEIGLRIKDKQQEHEREMLKNTSEIRKLYRTKLPCLKKVEKGKLFTEVRKVNELLKKIKLKDMTEENDLFDLGAALVTKVSEKTKIKQ